jgi:hypothetical protein
MAMPAEVADVLTEALRLAELGWRVVPIKSGHKYPPMKAWQEAASSNARTVHNWWGGLYRNHGVGIATGSESGVWVLDIDGSAGADSLAQLIETHGALPPTVEVLTGSGGRHMYFKHPGVKITTNRSQLGVGLDIRGDGGQVLAPPTIHPNGTPYRWMTSPWEVQVAVAPSWLLELCTEREREATPPPAPSQPTQESDSIADRYTKTTDFEALLSRDGWQVGKGGSDHQMWTRPGKDTRDGASAILHMPDGPFVVFSNSPEVAALGLHQPWAITKSGDGWSYSKFGYYAARNHYGNRSDAARQLRYELTGVQRVDPYDLVGDGTGTRIPPKDIRPPEDPADTDWEPIDLATILTSMQAGNYAPILPEVLAVRAAMPLFYRTRINSLFGESGGGKTWVALAAIVEMVRSGERALFLDYEDSAAGIAERLFLLGLQPHQAALIDYVNPTTGIGHGVEIIESRAGEYGLVVVDSTGEAMAAGGIDPNSDAETARWFVLVKHLCRLPGGPAVIVLDHVPKDRDAPSSYAIGSQRKRAAVTGAAYRVDTVKEPAKGRDGLLKLTVAKDRPGNRPKGATAAMVGILSTDGSVLIEPHLSEAQEAAERGEKLRKTVYMEKISRWLEDEPGATGREIEAAVNGKSSHVRDGLTTLVGEGWVVVEQDGQSKRHTVVRSYRESLDPVDNATASHRVPPRPERVPDAAANRVPASPPLKGDAGRGRSRGVSTNQTASPVDNHDGTVDVF